MKAGDLVRTKSIWEPWILHNPSWEECDLPEDAKIGIVIWTNGDMKPMVLWSDGTMERKWVGDLEELNESR